MVRADFELKHAYIEGVKAARSGFTLEQNPFRDAASMERWRTGYQTVALGQFQPVSFVDSEARRDA